MIANQKRFTLDDIRRRKEDLVAQCVRKEQLMRSQASKLFDSQSTNVSKAKSLANSFAIGYYVFDGLLLGYKLLKMLKGKPVEAKSQKKKKKRFFFF